MTLAATSSIRSFADTRTGEEIWQITRSNRPSEAVYFEAQGFSGDERYLVFRTEMTGQSELARADLIDGSIEVLTRGSGCDGHSITVHPDGRRALYVSERALQSVDIAGGASRVLFELDGRLPGSLRPYAVSTSADGTLAALVVADAKRAPHMTLLLVDLASGAHRVVMERPEGFSHPMICPADADLITFVPSGDACWRMDLPQEQRARTWIVHARDGRPRPYVTPALWRTITHESWSPDGRRYYFFDKNYREWTPVSIVSMNADGSDWRAHLTSYVHRLGHGRCSSDGRFFIADCQERGNSPLYLVDLVDDTARILCWPDASNDGGHAACAHVHPSFSPRGTYVVYTSDVSGVPQVYVVPLR